MKQAQVLLTLSLDKAYNKAGSIYEFNPLSFPIQKANI